MGKALRETLEVVVLSLLMFIALQASVQNFRVEGSSMQPTLHGGQYLIVNKLLYLEFDWNTVDAFLSGDEQEEERGFYLFHPPQRGDVIVFEAPADPNRDFVKRVVGLPGDTVAIQRGRVLVNGQPLDEPYLTSRSYDSARPVTVPPDHYYVLGDNRDHSSDSRSWGPVAEDSVIGKVWFTYWPPGEAGAVQ